VRAGVPLVPAFSSVRDLVSEMPQRREGDLTRRIAEMVVAQFTAIAAAAEKCDAIVASGLFASAAAAKTVAEKMGIPNFFAAYSIVRSSCLLSTTHPTATPAAAIRPRGATTARCGRWICGR